MATAKFVSDTLLEKKVPTYVITIGLPQRHRQTDGRTDDMLWQNCIASRGYYSLSNAMIALDRQKSDTCSEESSLDIG